MTMQPPIPVVIDASQPLGTQPPIPVVVTNPDAFGGGGGFKSLEAAGAIPYDPDNPVDNWESISTALSDGGIWTGGGKIYGVAGNVLPTQAAPKRLVGLAETELVQLTPTIQSCITLTWSNIINLYSRNVKVRRHLDDVDNATNLDTRGRGILVSGCENLWMENTEVEGDGPGVLFLVEDSDEFTIIRPYTHDGMWKQAVDPRFEQMVGFRVNRNGKGRIYSPHSMNLVGQIGTGRVGPYQTTLMTVTNNDDVEVYGINLENAYTGFDASGSEPTKSRGFKLIGGNTRNCSCFGIKLTHGAENNVIHAITTRDTGVAGIIISVGGGDSHNLNTMATSCASYGTGVLASRPEADPDDPDAFEITQSTSTSGLHIVGGPKGTVVRDYKAISSVASLAYLPNMVICPENVVTYNNNAYVAEDNQWQANTSYAAGTVVTNWAWYFKANVTHVSSGSFRADLRANLWKRGVKTPNILAPTWPNGANPPVHTSGTVTDAAGIPWTYMGKGIAAIAGGVSGSGYGKPQVIIAPPDLPGGRPAAIAVTVSKINGSCSFVLQYRGWGYTFIPPCSLVDYSTGQIVVTGQPDPGNTLTLNGTVITFVTGTATGNQVLIGVDTHSTLVNLFNFLRFSSDPQIVKCGYLASSDGKTIVATFKTSGPAGQSWTMAKSGNANYSVSGPTLNGGAGTGATPTITSLTAGAEAAQMMGVGVMIESVAVPGDVAVIDPYVEGAWTGTDIANDADGGNVWRTPVFNKILKGGFVQALASQTTTFTPILSFNKSLQVFGPSYFYRDVMTWCVNGLNSNLTLPAVSTAILSSNTTGLPNAAFSIDGFLGGAGLVTAVTNATTPSGPILNFAAVPDTVVVGMTVQNLTTPSSISAGSKVLGFDATTVTLDHDVTAAVGNGDTIEFFNTSLLPQDERDQKIIVEATPDFTLVDSVRSVSTAANRVVLPNPKQAKGFFNFTGVPSPGDTIKLNTTTFTFVASAPTGNQILIGADPVATASNVVTALSASADANAVLATYAQDITTTSKVNVTYKTVSSAGNSFALVKTGVNIAVSAATLSGGGSADIFVPAGRRKIMFKLHYQGQNPSWLCYEFNVY